MRHLFLAENDYAASGNQFCRALRAVGEDARCIVRHRHEFGYPQQGDTLSDVGGKQAMYGLLQWAEFVWIIQSDLPQFMGGSHGPNWSPGEQRGHWLGLLNGKQIVLLHGGGYYRALRQQHQDAWRNLNPISICYEADLMGGFAREHLVVPPLDATAIKIVKRKPGRLRVGHFPARPTDKGSEWIVPMLAADERLDFRTNVIHATSPRGAMHVKWPQQLERMAACDAVVDQIKPTLNGQPFGEWVSIATETAMLGRIPIANSLNTVPYVATYGERPGIHICNDRGALAAEIDRLLGLSERELNDEQMAARAWAEKHHDLKPTGRLLLRLLEIERSAAA